MTHKNTDRKSPIRDLQLYATPLSPWSMTLDRRDLAAYIDHTVLHPDATLNEVAKACDAAKHWGFAGVCVRPSHIRFVAQQLLGTSILPISVIDFPKGNRSPLLKAEETEHAIEDGAREIDVCLDVDALCVKDYQTVFEGIKAVVQKSAPLRVKVILETSALTHDQIVIGCALAQAAGAHFVKTSTGFGARGATVQDVELTRLVIPDTMGLKASGGIKTYQDAIKMINAGATRLGTSASVALISNAPQG